MNSEFHLAGLTAEEVYVMFLELARVRQVVGWAMLGFTV